MAGSKKADRKLARDSSSLKDDKSRITREDDSATQQEKKRGRKRQLTEEESAATTSEREQANERTKKKKRISFALDMNDGDADDRDESGTKISIDSTQSTKKEDQKGSESAAAQPASEEVKDEDPKSGEKKKRKKEKKGKGNSSDLSTTTTASNNSAPTASRTHETPILSYLSRYHKNRSAWKFQKNREAHLFKHLFSLEHVPAQYNTALAGYLRGLKSESARQRLSKCAEEIVKADLEGRSLEDNDKSKTSEPEKKSAKLAENGVYDHAVHAFRSWLSSNDLDKKDFAHEDSVQKQDDDICKRLEKRQRADLVYFAVNGRILDLQKPRYVKKAQKESSASGASTKKKRKRKSRTAFIEISSSSESEDESEGEGDKGPKNKSGKDTAKSGDDTRNSKVNDSDTSDTSSDSSSDTAVRFQERKRVR